jgi:hypothetical protein
LEIEWMNEWNKKKRFRLIQFRLSREENKSKTLVFFCFSCVFFMVVVVVVVEGVWNVIILTLFINKEQKKSGDRPVGGQASRDEARTSTTRSWKLAFSFARVSLLDSARYCIDIYYMARNNNHYCIYSTRVLLGGGLEILN